MFAKWIQHQDLEILFTHNKISEEEYKLRVEYRRLVVSVVIGTIIIAAILVYI